MKKMKFSDILAVFRSSILKEFDTINLEVQRRFNENRECNKEVQSEKNIPLSKCLSESCIENISLVCSNNHRYDFSKKGYIHLINNYKPTNIVKSCLKLVAKFFSNDFL